MAYTINLDDTGAGEAIPTSVEQWYDRGTRSWVTSLRDQDGQEIEATYDGTKADAAASHRHYTTRITEETPR